MQIEMLQVGSLSTNCYLVKCTQTKQIAIIDPGGDSACIMDTIATIEGEVAMIVNTHGHADHIGGNKELKEAYNCDIYVHKDDAERLTNTHDPISQYLGLSPNQPAADVEVGDGERVVLGNIVFTVIHTPGHTPGGMCLYTEGHLFSGDTLFKGSMGRYDLPGGNLAQLQRSLKRLCHLPDETLVYPGHGPTTSIAVEKRENPFCQ